MPLTVRPPLKSRKLPKALANLAKLDKQLHRIGVKVLKEVHRNLSGRYLHKQSGTLYGSWDYEVRPLPHHGYRLSVYADLGKAPYARIHDLGGMTGRGHKTKIRRRSYAKNAWITSYNDVQRITRKWLVEMFRG
jgi:hypothetical protein